MKATVVIGLLAVGCLITGCATGGFDELDRYVKTHKYTPFRPQRDADGAGAMISYNRLGQESTMAAADEFLPTNAVPLATIRIGALKTSYLVENRGGITLGLAKVFDGILDLDAALTYTNVRAV